MLAVPGVKTLLSSVNVNMSMLACAQQDSLTAQQ